MSHTIASTLNPEAGTHAVTADLRLQDAARAAAARSYEAFPYYEARYGERGLGFGFSDGAWLVTLVDMEARAAMKHIRWLGSVLASRGMPRLLLERHLEFLREELLVRAPGAKAEASLLKRGAASLRRERERVIAGDVAEKLAAEFERKVRKCEGAIANVAPIVIAAVADDVNGVDTSLPAVREWLTDEARFDKVWIGAVRKLLEAARAAAAD